MSDGLEWFSSLFRYKYKICIISPVKVTIVWCCATLTGLILCRLELNKRNKDGSARQAGLFLTNLGIQQTFSDLYPVASFHLGIRQKFRFSYPFHAFILGIQQDFRLLIPFSCFGFGYMVNFLVGIPFGVFWFGYTAGFLIGIPFGAFQLGYVAEFLLSMPFFTAVLYFFSLRKQWRIPLSYKSRAMKSYIFL